MKLVSDIMRLSGRDLRDSVLSILTEEWPLSAREIYKRVSKDYKINVTYQGVHKAVRQMADEGLLVPREGRYSINLQWVNQLVSFGKKVEGAYHSKTAGVPLLEVGAGSSVEGDAFAAGREAASKALRQLRFNSKLQLALLFVSSAYESSYNKLLKGVKSIIKGCPLAGCTTLGGEICNGPLSKSAVLSVFASDSDSFTAQVISIPIPPAAYDGKADALRKSIEKAVSVSPRGNGFGIVLFPGYTQANGMHTVAPIAMPIFSQLFGKTFPFIGGLAGDDWKFNSTALFKDDDVLDDSILLISVSTTLPFEIRNVDGYSPKESAKYSLTFDKQGHLTHMTQKAGKGKRMDAVSGYCKAVGMRESAMHKYLPKFIKDTISMNMLSPLISFDSHTLSFPLKIMKTALVVEPGFKTGDVIQIGNTSPQKLVEIVGNLAKQMTSGLTKPACMLLFPCGLFEAVISRADLDEIAAAKACLPKGAPVIGFYCSGEIGEKAFPLANGTVSALVISSE